MTPRARSPKTRGTKGPKNGRHRTAVVLEQVYGQMKVVLDRLNDTATRGEVMEVMTHVENLGGRMGLVEDVIRQTRKELGETRKELGETRNELGGRLDGLEQEVRGVRQDVARQAQGSELRALDQRMAVVERHLGI
jgi:hypothetical protein